MPAYWVSIAAIILVAVNYSIFIGSGRGGLSVTYLIGFFFGVFAAKLLVNESGRREIFEYLIVGGTSALDLYLFLPVAGECQSAYGVIFLGLLFVALRVDFRNRLMEFFANISYNQYFLHTIIGYPLIDYFVSAFGVIERFLALLFASVVTVGVATVSFCIIGKIAININIDHKVSSFRLGI